MGRTQSAFPPRATRPLKGGFIPRIVSLLPSGTEIVCTLGFEKQLVGRSHECDYPAAIRKLPACTSPAFSPDGSSLEIDERVKALLKDGHPIFNLNLPLIKSLNPDVIVTQSHCEVCAVSTKDVLRELGQGSYKLISLTSNAMSDVWDGFQLAADALGVPERAQNEVARLRGRMDAVVRKVHEIPERPTVACIEWIEPLMAAGNWVPELVKMAGGTNLFGEAGKHSPWLKWEQVVAADPDFIFILPCGFDIKKTRAEMNVLVEKPEWLQLKAVRNNRVILFDGNKYMNRPGPHLVESLEMMAEVLHEEWFDFGHKLTGWQYL